MNKKIITIFLILLSDVCYCQIHSDTIKLVQSGKALFVVKGNNSFEINQNVITVKTKTSNWAKDRYKIIRSNILGYYDISVPEGESVEEYYDALKQTREFDLVKYNTFYSYCSTPNDYHVGDQWYLGTINAFNAWDLTMGSPAIKVAVIDSGIDVTHEDLGYGNDSYSNINVLYGYNTISDYPHGTIIAGIIGAKANNSIGIAGIAGGNHAEGATIYSYFVGTVQPDGSLIDDAIIDAVNDGVNIIQLSLEGDYSQDIQEAIDYAYEHNVSVICCSGNDYSQNPTSSPLLFPAYDDKVITVGGTDYNNERLTFSRYGNGLDLVAPGIDIISTTKTPISHLPYFSYAGTSYAAPQVSAVVALMLSVNPNLTPDEIKTILRNTAYKVPSYTFNNRGWNNEVGYGLLDAYAAVDMAQYYIEGNDTLCITNVYQAMALPTGATVTWSLSGSNASKFNLVQNSPSANKCTITKKANAVFSSSSFNLTLTANIYQSGTLIKTKTKTLTCNNGFACTYWQDAHSYYGVNYPAVTETQMTSATNYVYPGGIVYLQSEYFRAKVITTSGIFDNFQYAGRNVVKLSLPPYSSSPAYINISANGCDEAMQLTFYPKNSGLLSYTAKMTSEDGKTYRINLMRSNLSDDENSLSNTLKNTSGEKITTTGNMTWSIEVNNAMTGNRMISATPEGQEYTLCTTGWAPGLYVVCASVDGEPVMVEKIRVK